MAHLRRAVNRQPGFRPGTRRAVRVCKTIAIGIRGRSGSVCESGGRYVLRFLRFRIFRDFGALVLTVF